MEASLPVLYCATRTPILAPQWMAQQGLLNSGSDLEGFSPIRVPPSSCSWLDETNARSTPPKGLFLKESFNKQSIYLTTNPPLYRRPPEELPIVRRLFREDLIKIVLEIEITPHPYDFHGMDCLVSKINTRGHLVHGTITCYCHLESLGNLSGLKLNG